MGLFTMDNLVFLLPLGLSVTWFALSSLLGLDSDGDGDADLDLDGALEADADVDADLDADGDGDVDGDDAEAHHLPAPILTAIAFVGIGRVPLILWLEMVGVTWGGTGLLASGLGAGYWSARAVAAAATLLTIPPLSRLLHRVMPQRKESDTIDIHECLGMIGRVVTTKVTETYGEAVFTLGEGKAPLRIHVRTEAGHPVLPEHTEVAVIETDSATNFATVMPTAKLLAEPQECTTTRA